MHFPCMISKATDTHSEYIIYIVFPRPTAVTRRRVNVTLYEHFATIVISHNCSCSQDSMKCIHSRKSPTMYLPHTIPRYFEAICSFLCDYSCLSHMYIRPKWHSFTTYGAEIGRIVFNDANRRSSSRKHIFICWAIWNLRLWETWGSVVASNSHFRRGTCLSVEVSCLIFERFFLPS